LYVVVNCPQCGEFMLAKTVNKTRTCPNCGHRSEIGTLRILGKADSPKQAVLVIQTLKERRFRKR
jgi:DNA-directed RNA polymerase subunit M/transcription elongation factor TFIIS